MSSNELQENNITYIGLNGKNIDATTKMPIIIEKEDFKDSLLANLYSTVEFLKNEVKEKNDIIKILLSNTENICLPFKNTSDRNHQQVVETSSESTSEVILVSNDINSQEGNLNNQDNHFYNITDNKCNNSLNEWNAVKYRKDNHGNKRQSYKTKEVHIPLNNRFEGCPVDEYLIEDDDNNNSRDISRNDSVHSTSKSHYIQKSINSSINSNKSKVYTNKYPEGNMLPLRNVAIPIKPKKDAKISIISASITKPIDMVEFNRLLVNGHAVKRAHGGATAAQLNYYVHATLNEDHPDTIIINGGTNNLTKKHQSTDETAKEIVEIAKTCRSKGVKNVFVSSITCRPEYQRQIDDINRLLQYYAGIYNYVFIDNSCITKKHLKRDGVHLNKEGICILASNFLAHLNAQPLLPFESIWD